MSTHAKHLPAAERRMMIVETVVELAGEQNPSNITTAAIAKRMGLTQGSLFRHFTNKDAILQAVMTWVDEQLLSRIESVAQKSLTPLATLEAMFMEHIGFIAEYPGVPRILFGELQRPEQTAPKCIVQVLIRSYGDRLQEVIEEGKACGELDSQLDTEASSTLFIGTIQGLVIQSLLAGDINRIHSDALRAFAIYRRGIRSQP